MDEKRDIHPGRIRQMKVSEDLKVVSVPVRYERDVVGPPPRYTPFSGSNEGYEDEKSLEFVDSVPVTTTTTTTFVTNTNDVAEIVILTPDPVEMRCPYCGQDVVTDLTYENGLLTWLLAGGLVVFGCWLGCCLIPTCVKACKDVLHTCPNCKRLLGIYRRL